MKSGAAGSTPGVSHLSEPSPLLVGPLTDGPGLLFCSPQTVGGGLEVDSWSRLPQGSGLGASSILAAALVSALWTVAGHSYTKNDVIHAVSRTNDAIFSQTNDAIFSQPNQLHGTVSLEGSDTRRWGRHPA